MQVPYEQSAWLHQSSNCVLNTTYRPARGTNRSRYINHSTVLLLRPPSRGSLARDETLRGRRQGEDTRAVCLIPWCIYLMAGSVFRCLTSSPTRWGILLFFVIVFLKNAGRLVSSICDASWWKNQLQLQEGYIHGRCDRCPRNSHSVHHGTRKLSSKANFFRNTKAISGMEYGSKQLFI